MARVTVPNSGFWSTLANLINNMFTEVYTFRHFGVYDYNDAATQTTPISIASAGVWYDLTNDALGSFTNKTYAHPEVPDVWDSVTNQFDFTDLELGDTIDIRLDVEVTTTNVNQVIDIELLLGVGAAPYSVPFIVEQAFKAAGSRQVIRFNGIYMGDTNTLNNPAKFRIKSDSTGSVKVNGWYCRVEKRVMEL